MNLSEDQVNRYSRNISLREIGGIGQRKLLKSKILVVGAGGLGSPVLTYLAAAGVGHIGIVDSDILHDSNLNRQVIHTTKSLGKKKAESAMDYIKSLNPDINIDIYTLRLHIGNIKEIIKDYDCVVDCVDTLQVKFLLNDACVEMNKIFFHAGVVAFNGQIMTVKPKESACLRCIFPEVPDDDLGPTSSEVGILGSCAGVMGSLLATEVIKYITGNLNITDRLLVYDGVSANFRNINIQKRDDCPVCSKGKMLPDKMYQITRSIRD